MATWSTVLLAAPDLANTVRARFDAHGLALIATLRRDGFPRMSGIEPFFTPTELWLGMMPGSRKATDLFRDPRFALHSATIDKQVTHGDAKITGRAVAVNDETAMTDFLAAFQAQTGATPPPGPFHLFRADIYDLSTVRPAGDHLDIVWWREGGPVHQIERR